jgi:transcriptional regulator with XRE-family HTH domain
MANRIRSIFAGNLKRIRAAQKMSQEKLALKADVERAYLGIIERQKSSPTIDVVYRIAKALKVPPDELLRATKKQGGGG